MATTMSATAQRRRGCDATRLLRTAETVVTRANGTGVCTYCKSRRNATRNGECNPRVQVDFRVLK